LCSGDRRHLGHRPRLRTICQGLAKYFSAASAILYGHRRRHHLVLAAESTAHKRAEEHVRQLAESDPLTGLANYRRLVEALDSEIKRYGRSQSPFAVILLDLDHLKQINDTHGHLVGSRALCRLADILRLHSREIDVAARYGGDEFVLVLPETNTKSALLVAQRISDRLRNETEEPALSVSTGVAMYPFDGHPSMNFSSPPTAPCTATSPHLNLNSISLCKFQSTPRSKATMLCSKGRGGAQ